MIIIQQLIYSSIMQASSSSQIDQDKFLKSKHIEVQRSSFLASHYSKKSLQLRNSYNPKDEFGTRLSHYWIPGDTIWTVTWKKIKHNIITAFNPDTYSKQQAIKLKQLGIKHKIEVGAFIICAGVPYFIIYPLMRPRIMKARRQFLFQYYQQMQVFRKKLGVQTRVVPLHEMERNIQKQERKIKL